MIIKLHQLNTTLPETKYNMHQKKLISGDRKINFVLTNVTDTNVLHIYSDNEPKFDVVDMFAVLKMN